MWYHRVASAMMRPNLKQLLSVALMVGCSAVPLGDRPLTAIEQIQAQGRLEIISRNGPTTYYEGNNGLTGLEYTLARAFADELGVELRIHEEESLGKLIDRVATPTLRIGAASLTVTPARSEKVRFTTPYQEVNQQLLYRAGTKRPASIEDLIGKELVVIANSSHAERLKELKKAHPELQWRVLADAEMVDLVEMVHRGTIEHAVVDSNAFDLNRNLFPKARAAFNVSEAQALAWAFSKQVDDSLYQAAQQFFQRIQTDGTLAQVKERFYGHVDDMNYSDALVFVSRLETRLPRWEEYLKQAATKYDIEWNLLAAISYQESHWNPRARSYTGVRGLMMLTRATAKELGVTNRIDPQQSIDGGARYFKKIFNRIPADIQGQDRTWLALAAYNVGFGHMEDARVLTERMGGDPDKWEDVAKHLPLLAKRKYYRQAKHGYARGWEAVSYVQNIHNFYNVLAWHDQLKVRRMAASNEKTPPLSLSPVKYSQNKEDSISL